LSWPRRLFIRARRHSQTVTKGTLTVKKIIERKIRYDATVSDYECVPLDVEKQRAVLFYWIKDSFTINFNRMKFTVPKDSYTIAFYWADRPYNVYMWRDRGGKYLGAYFNIVRNTSISPDMVSYEDLIVDVMALPGRGYVVLDEHELPEPLERFENGYVHQSLSALTASMENILSDILSEAGRIYRHESLIPIIEQMIV